MSNIHPEMWTPAAVEARAARLAAQKDADYRTQLDGVMARMSANRQLVTDAQLAQWTWDNCTRRDMKALGWDERVIRKIAPDWNCDRQADVFKTINDLCCGEGAVIALVGERGVGKTQLAAEQTRLRIEASRAWYQITEKERTWPPPRFPGRYEKLGRLTNMFKPLHSDQGTIDHDRMARIEATWADLDLVTLDELHECEDLKTNMRFLADFVDRRYANLKDTILISNKDATTFLADMNPSVVSRMGHKGALIACNWRSWRATA